MKLSAEALKRALLTGYLLFTSLSRRGLSRPVALSLRTSGRHLSYLLTAILSYYDEVHLVRGSSYAALSVLVRLRKTVRFKVRFVHSPSSAVDMFCDYDAETDNRKARTIRMDFDYYGAQRNGEPAEYMPLYMHPTKYWSGAYRTMAEYRSRHRDIRLFFSGTVGPVYDRGRVFGVMTRDEIINRVQNGFASHLSFIEDRTDLSSFEGGGAHEVVFNLTRDQHNTQAKFRLSEGEFLDFLARSDFVLCPPGLVPPTHIMIEAMAMGTIPVFNSPHLFQPRLRDGYDCLSFSTPDELDAVVRRVLEMDAQEIQKMHERVREFFDRNLDPATWFRGLLSRCGEGLTTVYVEEEHKLVELLEPVSEGKTT